MPFKREPYHYGCRVHRRVYFSKREMEEHIKSGCHPENIDRLDSLDLLDHCGYNMFEESLDNSNMGEKEKEECRQIYGWK